MTTTAPEHASGTAGDLTPADLEALADAFMDTEMADKHVTGAALVAVRGEEVLLVKGYGTANLEADTPVTPETVFRAGSIAKLFTATAVMHLVEQGQVDLEADVNTYLKKFQLETRFPGAVALEHLLTHTAGYDEHYLGGHARSAEQGQPLGDYLSEHMPPQTAPAGEFISYNDHTMSLAGFVVEEVSGMPFEEYVRLHITDPLGMEATSFHQPAPDEILAQLATGYAYSSGEQRPFQYDYIHVSPAAALLTTAGDMGAFLRANLVGSSVLAPKTLELMHTTHFRHHETLRGRAYGFSEQFFNGVRVLFHDGGNPGFISRLVLIPEHNIGFFMTANTDQFSPGGRLNRDFTDAFFERYFPETGRFEAPEPASGVVVEPERYTGYYREMQGYSHYTIQKLVSVMNQFPVTANEEGRLVTLSSELIPRQENVFQWANNPNHIVFRQNEAGEITHMFFGTGAFVRLKWYETRPFHLALAAIFLVTFLSAVVVSLLPAATSLGGIARAALGLMGGLNLVFLVGIGLTLARTSQWEFTYGLTTRMTILLAIPFLTILLTVGMLVFGAGGWSAASWPLWLRIYYSLAALIAAGFIPFLHYWNLLGWRG